ncbi:replication protein A 70 kDa DNA-binding subunit B [Pseudoscourfieldia marina]
MASVTAPNHNNVPLTPSACTRLRNKAFAPNEPLVVSVSAWTPISSSNTKHKAILMDDMDTRLPCVFNLPLENASNSQPSMVKLTAYSWKTVKTADQNDKEILIVDKAEIATEGTGASSDEQKENNNSNEPAAKRVKAEAGNAVAAETAPANKTTHAETKAEPSAPAAAAAAVAPKAAAAAPKANPNVRRKIISAEGLSPYMSSGTLKLRVTSKRPIRTVNTRVGEKDVLNVELAEAGTGFSIEATAWGDNARKFDEVLVEGRTFYVTKMRVALASKKYKSTDSDYTLGLENDTVIEALSDDEEAELVASEGDPNVAIVKAMAGVNISDIAVKMAKNPRMLVDVFGVVTEVGAVRSVKRKSDGSELQTREVTIVDDTGKSVNCALWGELVDKECAEMDEHEQAGGGRERQRRKAIEPSPSEQERMANFSNSAEFKRYESACRTNFGVGYVLRGSFPDGAKCMALLHYPPPGTATPFPMADKTEVLTMRDETNVCIAYVQDVLGAAIGTPGRVAMLDMCAIEQNKEGFKGVAKVMEGASESQKIEFYEAYAALVCFVEEVLYPGGDALKVVAMGAPVNAAIDAAGKLGIAIRRDGKAPHPEAGARAGNGSVEAIDRRGKANGVYSALATDGDDFIRKFNPDAPSLYVDPDVGRNVTQHIAYSAWNAVFEEAKARKSPELLMTAWTQIKEDPSVPAVVRRAVLVSRLGRVAASSSSAAEAELFVTGGASFWLSQDRARDCSRAAGEVAKAGASEADAKAALRERFQDDDTRCNHAVAIYEAQDRARDCSRAAGEVAKAGASEADAKAALRERFKDDDTRCNQAVAIYEAHDCARAAGEVAKAGASEADAMAALRERFKDDDTRCNQAVAMYKAQDRARDCSRAAGEVAKAGASEADAMAALRERFKDDDTRCNQAVAMYEAQDRARAAGEVAKAGGSEADAKAALRERFKDDDKRYNLAVAIYETLRGGAHANAEQFAKAASVDLAKASHEDISTYAMAAAVDDVVGVSKSQNKDWKVQFSAGDVEYYFRCPSRELCIYLRLCADRACLCSQDFANGRLGGLLSVYADMRPSISPAAKETFKKARNAFASAAKKWLKKSSMSIETARSYELNELDESHKPKMHTKCNGCRQSMEPQFKTLCTQCSEKAKQKYQEEKRAKAAKDAK